MKLSGNLTINASATDVWRILAHQFDDIGVWASGIAKSTPNPNAVAIDSAPVAGRICHVPAFGEVHETFTMYDEEKMTYTYEALVGLPFFVTAARNTWQVRAIDATNCTVRFDAELELIPLIGFVLSIPMRWKLKSTIDETVEELKYFAETGQIHPRKQNLLMAS